MWKTDAFSTSYYAFSNCVNIIAQTMVNFPCVTSAFSILEFDT